MTKFIEDSNISTKKVKVQVRACHTPNFVANLQQKVKVSQMLTWTFTFLVGIFAISSELSNFSLLGGTSSILRTFLGGTSKKKPPCMIKKCFFWTILSPWHHTGRILWGRVPRGEGGRGVPRYQRVSHRFQSIRWNWKVVYVSLFHADSTWGINFEECGCVYFFRRRISTSKKLLLGQLRGPVNLS